MGVIVKEKVKGSGEWWIFIYHNGRKKTKKIGDYDLAENLAQKIRARLALEDLGFMAQKKDPVRLKEGLRVLAIVPILYEGEVIACLNLGSHVDHQVPAPARFALETIAAQIGEVIVRIRAEEAIKESEKQYRTLQENIPIGIYRTTPTGKIISGNPAMVQMLGYQSEHELLSINAKESYLDPRERKKFLKELWV